METAKNCQPTPATFVSSQSTEPFRAVPHDQQRSQGTFKPNENHEVQETYAEIHYPPQNGTETQPNVTKVDQEQEFQELNQSISSNEGQDQSSHQNHTACQDDRKIVEKKHSDENQPHQNKQNSGNEKQQEKNVTMKTAVKKLEGNPIQNEENTNTDQHHHFLLASLQKWPPDNRLNVERNKMI
jgi:hypothetical protein